MSSDFDLDSVNAFGTQTLKVVESPKTKPGDIWHGLPPRTPFRRAIAKFRELFRVSLLPPEQRIEAAAKVRPYKGRGKNFSYPFTKRCESRQPKPSKYEPHQGELERARRCLDATNKAVIWA